MIVYLNAFFHHTHEFQRPQGDIDIHSTKAFSNYVELRLIIPSTHKSTLENPKIAKRALKIKETM